MALVQKVLLGSKAVLAHFHIICNGQKPFEIDWAKDAGAKLTQLMAQLSDDEVEFIQVITPVVKEKSETNASVYMFVPAN